MRSRYKGKQPSDCKSRVRVQANKKETLRSVTLSVEELAEIGREKQKRAPHNHKPTEAAALAAKKDFIRRSTTAFYEKDARAKEKSMLETTSLGDLIR